MGGKDGLVVLRQIQLESQVTLHAVQIGVFMNVWDETGIVGDVCGGSELFAYVVV